MLGCKVTKIDYVESRKVVYDIEVENAHNFYANNILVHNCAVFTSKKKYFARVIDSEGVRYSPYKMKVTGLEIARSSTPPFVKEKLNESLGIILDSDEKSNLVDWVVTVKEEFYKEPLSNISRSTGVSNIEYDLDNSKSIPIGSRGALVHNRYVERNGLDDTYSYIQAGDKTKQIYLTTPNPVNSDVISYLDDRFIEIFKDYIDHEKCFDKYFISPLKIMTTPMNWDITILTQSLDDW